MILPSCDGFNFMPNNLFFLLFASLYPWSFNIVKAQNRQDSEYSRHLYTIFLRESDSFVQRLPCHTAAQELLGCTITVCIEWPMNGLITIPQSHCMCDSPAGPAPLLSALRTFSPLTGKSSLYTSEPWASCNLQDSVLQYPHESDVFFMIKVLFLCHGTT